MSETLDRLRDYEAVTRTIETFESGGRITGIMVTSAPDMNTGIMMTAGVDVSDMPYPEQMVTAIKSHLLARRATIAARLMELGVTGLGT